MSEFTVVAVALGLGVPLFFAAILSLIFFVGRPRPVEGLGPRPAAAPAPDARAAHPQAAQSQAAQSQAAQSQAAQPQAWGPPQGRWNALILANGFIGSLGGTAGSAAGTFEVANGHLSFTANGQDVPLWTVPCPMLAARAQSAFAGAGVVLWTPHGEVRCNVSREHINRFTRNSIKTLREAKYYREFVDVLVANGARWA